MKLHQFSEKGIEYLLIFVIFSVPLLFGAVHPIVQGSYVAIVILGCGSWLLWSKESLLESRTFSWWHLPLVILFLYLTIQLIPLPLSWVEFISPARAERVLMVNTLAGLNLQFVSLSETGLISLQRVVLLFALVLFYLTLTQLLHRSSSFFYILISILALIGTIEALYGLFQFLNPHVGILWLSIKSRAAYGTIIYKNQYASLLNMCWPVVLSAAVAYFQSSFRPSRRSGRKRKIQKNISQLSSIDRRVPLYFAAAGIMMMAVLFSLSRGGIIAMLLVMTLLTLLLPLQLRHKVWLAVSFLVFIVGYGSILGIEVVVNRFNSIGISGETRWPLYVTSLPMLWDHWLSGIGIGSYNLLSPIYLKGFPAHIRYDRAHNEYLELFIELGIPFASLFFGWLCLIMISSCIKIVRKVKSKNRSIDFKIIVTIGAFCGLTGFLVHGFVDFGWRLPANLFYAVTLASLLSHGLEYSHDKKST